MRGSLFLMMGKDTKNNPSAKSPFRHCLASAATMQQLENYLIQNLPRRLLRRGRGRHQCKGGIPEFRDSFCEAFAKQGDGFTLTYWSSSSHEATACKARTADYERRKHRMGATKAAEGSYKSIEIAERIH